MLSPNAMPLQWRLKNITVMTQLLKKFFREFDMFQSYSTLRTKGEPESRNTCAGIFSFLLLILFAYVFVAQLIEVTSWNKITAIQTQNNTVGSERSIGRFMIGVGLQGFRIQGIMEYLRFQVKQVVKNGSMVLNSTRLQTEKCTVDHWQQLGDQKQQNYLSFNLKNKLCLVPNQTLSIQQPSTGIYSILTVQVNACRRMDRNQNFLYSGCANENDTEAKNRQWIEYNKYFVVNVVYMNTLFNPLSRLPTHRSMEAQKLTFTITQGMQAYIYLSTYQIQTDTSILPYTQIEQQTGYYTDKSDSNVFQIVWYFQHASCTFLLSSKSMLFQRSIGKIDELLSYAGGLFGMIVAVFGLCMNSFDEYRYEIMAAQSAFSYNNEGKKIKESDFTFFKYLKYQVFDWVKTLFCYEIKWQDCKEVDQVREESAELLDVSLILKKLLYFEHFIEYIITDKQKIALFLTENPSLAQVRKNRLIAGYYDKIMQGESSLTVENYAIVKGIFEMVEGERGSLTEIGETMKKSEWDGDEDLSVILEKYENEHGDAEVDFTEEEREIEKEISYAFFSIPENARRRIARKIPLKILSRLHKIKGQKFSEQLITINLRL